MVVLVFEMDVWCLLSLGRHTETRCYSPNQDTDLGGIIAVEAVQGNAAVAFVQMQHSSFECRAESGIVACCSLSSSSP